MISTAWLMSRLRHHAAYITLVVSMASFLAAPVRSQSSTPVSGTVRLDTSYTSPEGYSVVEIYISGHGWGTICDDMWNLEGTVNTGRRVNADNFATVVCGQLGCELSFAWQRECFLPRLSAGTKILFRC